MTRKLAVALTLVFLAISSCTKKEHPSQMISESQWSRIEGLRIYFGHQSVGENILDGIRDIEKQSHRNSLRIVSSDDPSSIEGPALIESHVGRNGDPTSKNIAFRDILDKGFGAQGGIALYKYCFVDIRPETDVAKMFAEYRDNMRDLRSRYPRLTIVHVTIPLTTVEPGWKAVLKNLLGRPTERAIAEKRHQFNQLLRQEYAGKEPIFDLAEAESTLPDGSRAYFISRGERIYTLAPEYTYDGGHLNESGRNVTALRLLQTLAQF
ncbi:MAG TPA: SGNH/GDSL hydrolase family protein [Pseudacidobacterium sp.]|nr:SGNH/GDSL hydrolase family protein [Pseudacidobacterium sp.]